MNPSIKEILGQLITLIGTKIVDLGVDMANKAAARKHAADTEREQQRKNVKVL